MLHLLMIDRTLSGPSDLGLEGTSLNEILYKNAAFLNLVDPISHELLLSLARDMQCPKRISARAWPKTCSHVHYSESRHVEYLFLAGRKKLGGPGKSTASCHPSAASGFEGLVHRPCPKLEWKTDNTFYRAISDVFIRC
ncbi:Leucine-rich repeat-containing protein 75B [Triplophysa tibetana]|uniref:Leucine-rich repeat-containing protein 75B n=1 Tax=Triplophysa tibetana TaxID=1572043 RepID=A0A5A9N355_9TELE|nr:Leucine-rich repeat-containing protein 75B [Triplophysa tibetana]